jgi:hypothetical protein
MQLVTNIGTQKDRVLFSLGTRSRAEARSLTNTLKRCEPWYRKGGQLTEVADGPNITAFGGFHLP